MLLAMNTVLSKQAQFTIGNDLSNGFCFIASPHRSATGQCCVACVYGCQSERRFILWLVCTYANASCYLLTAENLNCFLA